MQARSDKDIESIDISSYQIIQDENKLFQNCPVFAIFRAYGSNHNGNGDSSFEAFVHKAHAHNIKAGAYFFATPSKKNTDAEVAADAQAQAQLFIDKLAAAFGPGKCCDTIPWLDCESYTDPVSGTKNMPMASGMTGDQFIIFVKAFRDYFWQKLKRRVGIYASRYFLQDQTQMHLTNDQLKQIADMPLWLAEYDQNYPNNNQPQDIGPFTFWAMWQYTGSKQDADQYGLSSGSNYLDHSRCPHFDWVLPPSPIKSFHVKDQGGGILVTVEHPCDVDYLGCSVYIDGQYKAWIAKNATQATISGLPKGQPLSVAIQTEDQFHDINMSNAQSITLA